MGVARCKLDADFPPSVFQGPGLDDGECYGPQGLVAKYYHSEPRVMTTLMVPCLHTSQHKSTARSCTSHEPGARVPTPPRVSCRWDNELSNPGSGARNLDDGSGGSIA